MSNKRKLEGQVLVRIPVKLQEKLQQEATKTGLSCASVCRSVLVDAFALSSAEAVPVKQKSAPKPPAPEHILELVRLREATAELCGSLVHNSIRERQTGNSEAHQSLEEIIPQVRVLVRSLDKLKKRLLEH